MKNLYQTFGAREEVIDHFTTREGKGFRISFLGGVGGGGLTEDLQ